MTKPLSMAEVAAELGVHYDTLRKGWKDLCSAEGFPRPFLGRKWDPDQIAAWKAERSRRAHQSTIETPIGVSRPLKPRGGFAELRSA